MSSSRMLISYGIISDKNICKTLNIFTRENKRFCFFFLLYIWPLLPRGHQRSCIKWRRAAFRWYRKVNVEHMQAWRIVQPVPIGRAQVNKTSETCTIFRARTFGLKKLICTFSVEEAKQWKSYINSKYNREHQHTCKTLMFAYMQVSKLPYLLMDWEIFNQFPALKQARGVI